MFEVKNKSISLLWELNSIFVKASGNVQYDWQTKVLEASESKQNLPSVSNEKFNSLKFPLKFNNMQNSKT